LTCAILSLSAGEPDRLAGWRLLQAGRREGQDLQVDAGLVHLRNSPRAEVQQVFDQRAPADSLVQVTPRTFEEGRRRIVFFERDGPHVAAAVDRGGA
jgi:hypothetical protein